MNNYVISLTSAKERRKHIELEFGKRNIPFQFFDAITPDLIEITSKELGVDVSKSSLTKAEIACALSHIAILHLAKQKNLEYVCIFEDDIHLGKNAELFFNNSYIDENIDIVKIEKNFSRLNLSMKPIKSHLDRKFYILKTVNPGTAGYIVTRKGINFLTHSIKEINEIEIDNLIFKHYLAEKNYTIWQMQPAVCIQDSILYPSVNSLGAMLRNKEEYKQVRKKNTLTVKLLKEIKRPIAKLRLKLLGKNSTFE